MISFPTEGDADTSGFELIVRENSNECRWPATLVLLNEEDCGYLPEELSDENEPRIDLLRSGFKHRDELTLVITQPVLHWTL